MATAQCKIPGEPTNFDTSQADTKERRRELVKRILSSRQFRSSPRLVELFNYIAEASLRDAPEDATEQQIGQNVFGRKAGYNCSEDSIVRSEIRQLRLKLNLYFAEEGVTEDLIVEIPKGRYLLEFRSRISEQPHEAALETKPIAVKTLADGEESETGRAGRSSGSRAWEFLSAYKTLGAALTLLSVAAIALVFQRSSGDSTSGTGKLWAPFLSGNEPIVVYSNAMLRGTQNGIQDVSDLPHGTSATDTAPATVDDAYTGVGEVAAVHALDRVFVHQGRDFLLRRSLLLSWEEARGNNIIIVGSTAQNKAMKSLPTTKDFTFGNLNTGTPFWGIINHNAKPNEKQFYTGGDHVPQIEDYAIIALLQGPTEKHWILLLGGLGTYGTQAAAEFAMSEKGASRLLQLLGSTGDLHPFEAVLRFDMVGEVPLNPEIVAFHKR